jgi:hypothetical protein
MKFRVELAKSGLGALLFVASVGIAAYAQAPLPKAPPEVVQTQPTQQEHSDPNACAPRPETTGAPLGDKLAKTDGVICPPAGVDPDIKAPTPQSGTMPVIPPPGSTGGDPNIQPK